MVRNMSVVSAQLDVVYGATINIGEIVLYKIHGTRVMVLWCDIAQEGTTTRPHPLCHTYHKALLPNMYTLTCV